MFFQKAVVLGSQYVSTVWSVMMKNHLFSTSGGEVVKNVQKLKKNRN